MNLKIKISNFLNIKKINNKEKKSLLFITSLILFFTCGLHFYFVSTTFTIYPFFFFSIFIILFHILYRQKMDTNIPTVIGLITVIYFIYTQTKIGTEFQYLFTKVCTMSFFILGIYLLPKLNNNQVLKINNLFLLVNALLYCIDLLYRLILFKFNIISVFSNFYAFKIQSLLYFDTNMTGFITLMLQFYCFYLYEKFKNINYLIYFIIFTILTLFSFSRSAIFSMLVTFVIIYIFRNLKIFFQYLKRKNFSINKIPIRFFTSTITIFASLIIFLFLLFFILQFLSKDGSSLTKLKLYYDTFEFIRIAPLQELLYGVGFNNGKIYTIIHTHTYFTTYIIESGLIGFILMTSFLFSILLYCKKTYYILIPFFLCGLSFVSLSAVFYSILAFVCCFEKIRKVSKCNYQ